MALILNIDTAIEYASLALSNGGRVLGMLKNAEARDHASWVHQAIHELLIKCGYSLENLDAIAITAGPGSYTGLRIGMATAKGLCYVLNIPLIAENTLKVMTAAFLNQLATGPIGLLRSKGQSLSPEPLLVPMIDARRMEVYTAVYNVELNLVVPPSALILNVDSFNEWKEGHPMIFFGNGSKKFEGMVSDEDFEFRDVQYDASDMAVLSYRQFLHQQFADLAYAEPFYLKEFYSTAKK